jgi:hypothetical protein
MWNCNSSMFDFSFIRMPKKRKWQFTPRCYLYYDVTMTSFGGLSLECIQLVEWQVHVREHGLIIFNEISLLPLCLHHPGILPWVSASDCGSCLHHSSSSWFIGILFSHVSCSISSESISTSPKIVAEFILQGLAQKIYHCLHKKF